MGKSEEDFCKDIGKEQKHKKKTCTSCKIAVAYRKDRKERLHVPMICMDISNIWAQVSLPDLLAMENEMAAAHETLLEGTQAGGEWLELPTREATEEMDRIQKAAERIRVDSDVCVVAGIDGGCLGARAAMELLQGPHHNFGKGKGNPQIFFAGNNFSTRHWNELLRLLKDKDFSVIVVSKSGTTLEPAIALRSLRWMLERKYGTDAANRRIYAVTDPEGGPLGQMAREEGWESFEISSGVGEGYSVLTAAGLLPMAVAGIDILEVLAGAADAREEYALGSFENPVWQYAAVRNLLYRGGKAVEVLASFEPGFRQFGLWWQQLFAQSEGKEGKGLFQATAELTQDLHALGQMLQEGQRNLLETMVRFDPPEKPTAIDSDWKNLDGLEDLEGKTLDFVEENAFLATVSTHVDGGVPVIVLDCGQLTARKVGELFYFLQLCCGVSACLLGVNPFDRSGVEIWQQNLMQLLGKPMKDE